MTCLKNTPRDDASIYGTYSFGPCLMMLIEALLLNMKMKTTHFFNCNFDTILDFEYCNFFFFGNHQKARKQSSQVKQKCYILPCNLSSELYFPLPAQDPETKTIMWCSHALIWMCAPASTPHYSSVLRLVDQCQTDIQYHYLLQEQTWHYGMPSP